MASKRNNSLQARRERLKEQQKRELAAVDGFEKAIDKEWQARLATAQHVASAVAQFGKARTSDIFALDSKTLAAYLKDAEAVDESTTDKSASENEERSEASAPAPVPASAPTTQPTSSPLGVPGQSVPPVETRA